MGLDWNMHGELVHQPSSMPAARGLRAEASRGWVLRAAGCRMSPSLSSFGPARRRRPRCGSHGAVLLRAAATRWPRQSLRGRLRKLDGAILHPEAATALSFSARPPLDGAAGLRVATCSTAPSSPRSCHGAVLLPSAAARQRHGNCFSPYDSTGSMQLNW